MRSLNSCRLGRMETEVTVLEEKLILQQLKFREQADEVCSNYSTSYM